MPVRMKCGNCGTEMQLPDEMAGKQVQCPSCHAALTVPSFVALDSEPPGPPRAEPPHVTQEPARPAPLHGGGYEEELVRCPACGETVRANAARCPYCETALDPELREIERLRSRVRQDGDADLSGGDWLVAILCSGIGCILGIVWAAQGKPKGAKMIGVSLLFAVLWNLVRFAIIAARER